MPVLFETGVSDTFRKPWRGTSNFPAIFSLHRRPGKQWNCSAKKV